MCHDNRILSEYEGYLEVDDQLQVLCQLDRVLVPVKLTELEVQVSD
jgi:hypothetical protein